MLRLQLLTLLAALSPLTLAYPAITLPGVTFPVAAPIVLTWTDVGSPANSLLTTFTLNLMVGGNVPGTDSEVVGPVLTTTGAVVAGTYAALLTAANTAAAGETPNGFYFEMISVGTDGGLTYTYSPRFSLTGMTGVTPANYLAAVVAGAAPAPTPGAANAAGAATTPGAVGGGLYAIPYESQTGLTKYAPMQGLPPTKISAKQYTPLYPTSAVTIATTWLPPASIVTTLTESVTYSVSSMENTAAPQAQPTGDMAKFLARWKD